MAADQKGNEPGDVVLVQLDGKPAVHARLEAVSPHARPGWFECELLFLAHPPQPVTWILEREQIDGAPFTMGGRPVQIERLPDLGELHAERRRDGGSLKEAAVGKPARRRDDKVVRLVPKPSS